MSKLKVPSLDRSKATTEVSVSSYQSVWMAHWKVAKPPLPRKSNLPSLNHEARESDSTSGQEVTSSPSHMPERGSNFFQVPVKNTATVKDVVNNTVDIVDGTAAAMVSRDSAEGELFPASSLSLGLRQPGNSSFPPRNERASSYSSNEAFNPLAMQSSSKNWMEGYVGGSKQLFAGENFMGKKSVTVSAAFQGSSSRPSSREMAHSLHADGISLTCSAEKLDSRASVLTPSLWNGTASLLQNDNQPTDQERLLMLMTENRHRAFLSFPQVFPSQRSSLEETKRETFCFESSSRQSYPVIDVKTTTTRTFMDSNERSKAGQPMFSQTTRQLFYREKTDAHLSKGGGQTFRESTVYTNSEGNRAFGQYLSLSLNGNHHANPGVKLQPLWSLTDSKGHEGLGEGRTSVEAAKNELSAETNTLDMDKMSEKHIAGEASTLPEKELPSRKGSGGWVKVDLLKRKRKFLELATTSSSTGNEEPSPSKTRSLEVGHLLPRDSPGGHPNPDRNVAEQRQLRMRQLKASGSDQHHKEILRTENESPTEKVKNLFGRILGQMKVSSEPLGGNAPDEQMMGSGSGKGQSVKDGASTSGGNTKAGKGSLALSSDPWIQRWRRDQAATASFPKKQEPPVVQFEPFTTKGFNELQEKKMPSIAAMALMGKAMNGFHPCQLKKRGSSLVWNS